MQKKSKNVIERELSVSKVYANVLENESREYWDYENVHIEWGEQEPYKILKRIGRGRYSDVFKGVISETLTPCVIKVLKPIKRSKIRREILVLENLYNGPNIVDLLDVVLEPISKTPSLIMEYVSDYDFEEVISQSSPKEICYYMKQILIALDYAHSHGIMHRDVKPHNIVINPEKKQLKLIDWGLAEFYHPKTKYNVRVASIYYKGPELLVGIQDYDYSLDLWSFGCMFAAIIFKMDVLFKGSDNKDQLNKIVKTLGSDEFLDYQEKYKFEIDKKLMNKFLEYDKKDWKEYITKENSLYSTPIAIDLIDNLLRYDHQQRLTAKEAMAHHYFQMLNE